MNNDFIVQLYSRPETIFTVSQVALLFPQFSYESLRDRLYYFTKVGKLKRLHQGVYAKEPYNSFEFANKLYTPSYISLETVLSQGNVVFQYYETIFAVSYVTRKITVGSIHIQYRQMKGDVLINRAGVMEQNGYFIATLERAFLDAVYIYKNYHFDNLGVIDWKKVENLKRIYSNSAFEKRVEGLYKDYKEDYDIK